MKILLSIVSFITSVLISITIPLVVVLMPRGEDPVLLIGLPWHSEHDSMRVIAAADARILSRGRYDGTFIVAADGPDLTRRLYEAGAFLVLNNRFFIGCSP